jgi:hypothetical protein
MPRTMDFRYKPTYWYLRAEETRALAESMATIPECRDRLLRVAEEYEQMGQCLERMLRELLEAGRRDGGPMGNVTSFRPTG